MRCVVTGGPTYEPLDVVRRLTNFSTGQLGTELANFLTAAGHEVTLLLGEMATWSGERQAARLLRFGSGSDLRARLHDLAGAGIGGVFHAAAVSDFGFGKVWMRNAEGALAEVKARKLRSGQGTLLAELVPNPKILAELRGWFPEACIVGWKYEVEGGRKEAVRSAEEQLAVCRTQVCVVNGPAYGEGFGLICGVGRCLHMADKAALFAELERRLRG